MSDQETLLAYRNRQLVKLEGEQMWPVEGERIMLADLNTPRLFVAEVLIATRPLKTVKLVKMHDALAATLRISLKTGKATDSQRQISRELVACQYDEQLLKRVRAGLAAITTVYNVKHESLMQAPIADVLALSAQLKVIEHKASKHKYGNNNK